MCSISFSEKLRGQFVAYRLNTKECTIKIIDSDEDFQKLLMKLKRAGVDPRFVFIDYVPEEEVIYLL